MNAGQKDHTSIAQAVIIDERGVALASRSSFDVTAMFDNVTLNVGGEEYSFEFKSKFKKIEMELADGSRVPARVLVIDPKWDLVVLAPKKPLKPDQFTYVPINSTVEAKPLENLIFVRRLSPIFNNQVAVDLATVSTVLEKPMRMYYTNAGMLPSLPRKKTRPDFTVLTCDYINRVLAQARKNLE